MTHVRPIKTPKIKYTNKIGTSDGLRPTRYIQLTSSGIKWQNNCLAWSIRITPSILPSRATLLGSDRDCGTLKDAESPWRQCCPPQYTMFTVCDDREEIEGLPQEWMFEHQTGRSFVTMNILMPISPHMDDLHCQHPSLQDSNAIEDAHPHPHYLSTYKPHTPSNSTSTRNKQVNLCPWWR